MRHQRKDTKLNDLIEHYFKILPLTQFTVQGQSNKSLELRDTFYKSYYLQYYPHFDLIQSNNGLFNSCCCIINISNACRRRKVKSLVCYQIEKYQLIYFKAMMLSSPRSNLLQTRKRQQMLLDLRSLKRRVHPNSNQRTVRRRNQIALHSATAITAYPTIHRQVSGRKERSHQCPIEHSKERLDGYGIPIISRSTPLDRSSSTQQLLRLFLYVNFAFFAMYDQRREILSILATYYTISEEKITDEKI